MGFKRGSAVLSYERVGGVTGFGVVVVVAQVLLLNKALDLNPKP